MNGTAQFSNRFLTLALFKPMLFSVHNGSSNPKFLENLLRSDHLQLPSSKTFTSKLSLDGLVDIFSHVNEQFPYLQGSPISDRSRKILAVA